MQYVGEYDGVGAGSFTQLTLHVDGTFDASVAGQTTTGTFLANGVATAAEVPVRLVAAGTSSVATFHAAPQSAGPSRYEVDVEGGLGAATLTAPWVASDESECRATGGTWSDDDPDPATGLYCGCPSADLYLPSRGGCVGATTDGDPGRVQRSDAMRDAAGHYVGDGHVTDLQLEADGTYSATVDARPDAGTWWDADPPGTFALTSAAQAFWASRSSDDMTLDLGDETETLHRQP
jgi:hypothetical protein